MATPVVSGAAAVVRQFLVSVLPKPPSAALLKAAMITATRRLPPFRQPGSQTDFGFPDFDQGFGRLDLGVLFDADGTPAPILAVDVPNQSPEALESRAVVGGPLRASASFRFDVRAGRPLRITLCWTDRPAAYVQNNLSLEVIGPEGHIAGNADHRFMRNDALDDPDDTGIVFDKRNNVEQVVINAPATDKYRVKVIADNTTNPPQGFAVFISGDLGPDLETIR
jgi:hypothetical protein